MNCYICGRFMRHVEIEEHPDVDGEFYQRYECVCGAVDHQMVRQQ